MHDVEDLADHCPYCRNRIEIVCVTFRFSSVATVSACPNCAVIVPDLQHGKELEHWFIAKEPADTAGAIAKGLRGRYRHSLAFLVGAVVTAAFLRHTIHMQAGIAPADIRDGALFAAIALALVFVVKKRRP